MFGRKSERFATTPDPQQMYLVQLLGEDLAVSAERVPAHTRRKPRSDMADDGGCASFFDAAKARSDHRRGQPRRAGLVGLLNASSKHGQGGGI